MRFLRTASLSIADGFDQTAEIVRKGCRDGLSSELLLERILNEVRRFSGDQPQEDDQTIVEVEVESE